MGSVPEAEAVARDAPKDVLLSFTEPIVGAGSSVSLAGPSGRAVRLGRPSRRGSRQLRAAIRDPLRPGVYEVRWTVPGDDGHTVSGTFRFGVPTADGGAPPGVERLGAPGGRGEESAEGDGPLEVALRWLGLAAAGVLLAGALVRRRLEGEGDDGSPGDGGGSRAGGLAAAAVVAVAIASWYAAATAATAGDRDASLDLLVAQPTGVLALVRLGVVLALALAALRLRSRAPRSADALLGAAGAAALVTYALDGHVQTAGFAASAGQVLHVLAAGLWMGGLVVLALATPRDAASLRALAPVAAVVVAALALTGVLAALREVDAWYFLRWSDYGRVVLAKAALLLALGPAVAATALAVRRGRVSRRALRVEAAGALAVLLLASTLAGLAPGRGQPLPAQRGNLLLGAAFATVPAVGFDARLTVAPARPGSNTIAVTPAPPADAEAGARVAQPRSLAVTLRCVCAPRPVRTVLRRGRSGTWSAVASLPARGTWFATLSADGRPASPARLAVGDEPVRGSSPREVVMTADLTGRAATRCRAQAAGAILALGRLDAGGGLPGGRKVALLVLDDGGVPSRAAALVRTARDRDAIALLGPCGGGAKAALDAAGPLPAIASDPSAPPSSAGRHGWRTAGDPRAEGVAAARFLIERSAAVRPAGAPRRVAAVVGGPAPAAAQRIAGLEAELARAGVSVERVAPGRPPRPADLRRAFDPRRYAGALLDGDPDGSSLSGPLRALGSSALRTGLETNTVVAASPLLDEGFQERAGTLALSGGIASAAEVAPGSADGVRYVRQLQVLYPGERPQIAGIRGYVAGLALAEGLRDGDDPGDIAARLRRPRPFTDALVAPWIASAPAAGDPLFAFLSPRILPQSLVAATGGHRHGEGYFPAGTWVRKSSKLYGPAP
ncbi:MAG TPA: copper resistance protein CopC [Thermoleophilaceae bacterium]